MEIEIEPHQHVPVAVASRILAVVGNLPPEASLRHDAARSAGLPGEQLVDLAENVRRVQLACEIDDSFAVRPVPGERRRALAAVGDPRPAAFWIGLIEYVEWTGQQLLLEPVLTERRHKFLRYYTIIA